MQAIEKQIEETKEVAVVRGQIEKAFHAAEELTIKSPEDLTHATELLVKIRTVGKNVTSIKDGIAKPLNEALKAARAFFNPIELQWKSAEDVVKSKMLDYQLAERAKAAKKEEKIAEKVESGKMSFENGAKKIEAVRPKNSVATDTGSKAQFKKVKEIVIEDEAAVPREYLVLDMVKIRKVALAGVNIPGVKVIEKETLAVTI